MFTRKEIETAMSASKLYEDRTFINFIKEIRTLNTHMLYSNMAADAITTLLYDKELYDNVVSSLLVLYNELIQNREATNTQEIYKKFYESDILKDTKYVSIGNKVIRETIDKDKSGIDIVMELIILLNIYMQRAELWAM